MTEMKVARSRTPYTKEEHFQLAAALRSAFKAIDELLAVLGKKTRVSWIDRLISIRQSKGPLVDLRSKLDCDWYDQFGELRSSPYYTPEMDQPDRTLGIRPNRAIDEEFCVGYLLRRGWAITDDKEGMERRGFFIPAEVIKTATGGNESTADTLECEAAQRTDREAKPRGSGCGMPSHHPTCDCGGMGGDR